METIVGTIDNPMTEWSVDTLYDAVAHHRRRHVIDCLRENGSTTMTELVDAVAVREYERPAEEVPEKVLQGVHLTLYHAHIPKLESAAIIEYVRERDVVLPGEAFGQVVGLLVEVEDERS